MNKHSDRSCWLVVWSKDNGVVDVTNFQALTRADAKRRPPVVLPTPLAGSLTAFEDERVSGCAMAEHSIDG